MFLAAITLKLFSLGSEKPPFAARNVRSVQLHQASTLIRYLPAGRLCPSATRRGIVLIRQPPPGSPSGEAGQRPKLFDQNDSIRSRLHYKATRKDQAHSGHLPSHRSIPCASPRSLHHKSLRHTICSSKLRMGLPAQCVRYTMSALTFVGTT